MMVLSFPSHYFFRSVHFKACFFFFISITILGLVIGLYCEIMKIHIYGSALDTEENYQQKSKF